EHDWQPIPLAEHAADKGGFDHFMQKEIHEQPRVIADILNHYVHGESIHFPDAVLLDQAALPNRIVMVACGTSYHAALTARYWLERYLQVSVEVDVASEYRYRNPVIGPDTWLITLSQSGETADTLEALRLFKSHTPDNLALTLCNVAGSSLARESDGAIGLLAGAEIGVASTKAFTAQLAVLALLVLKMAAEHGVMDKAELRQHLAAMRQVVDGMHILLSQAEEFEALCPLFADIHGALFLGRGPCYPIALEGALKLKEISYLHAEGYAAGEMKHGPIALIDSRLPVVVLAAKQYHLQKVLSNLKEVQARGAKVILLTDVSGGESPDDVDATIHLPEGDYFTTPLFAAIPLQFLAYYVARSRGTDVDQPRNLAKSVTVE
ncbi:MAG: glutamine--fructose-6-phosphate transaminase (isomerizing), partial [Mariprofundaceae bacterium]|nr:glutamine--fructose-6-phosphate transaminase (isomerizing) [Mariprofundaceae bacterium]